MLYAFDFLKMLMYECSLTVKMRCKIPHLNLWDCEDVTFGLLFFFVGVCLNSLTSHICDLQNIFV